MYLNAVSRRQPFGGFAFSNADELSGRPQLAGQKLQREQALLLVQLWQLLLRD